MLETATQLITRAGTKLGLTKPQIKSILQVDQEHQFEIGLNTGRKLQAYRVQHNNKRGPYKGGIRFHHEVSLEEVRTLAILMSLKTAAVGLPLGGGKGGVVVNPRELSIEELEEISRKYVQHLHPHIGPDQDIPAPDVNTDSRIIDWMVDEYSKLTGDTSQASFTGKSIALGGSLGREAATGRGGVIALAELLSVHKKVNQPLKIAVQGFGNVGSFFAKIAQADHPNWKVLAVSDSTGAVYDDQGLNIDKLQNYKAEKGRFTDYQEADQISNADLLALDVDVLVLAALGDAVTEDNVDTIKADYIVELANGPINLAAHDQLDQQGVVILPDIIANAGGVIVSYLEWLQNKQGERWTESEVNDKLRVYMVKAVQDVLKLAKLEQTTSLTEAALMIALKRLAIP